MSTQPIVKKYENPGNPVVTAYINNIPIPNTLVDQRAAINIMIITTLEALELKNLRPTPTILELANRSKLKPIGILDDVMVSLVSWEHPVYFMVI